MGNLVTMPRAKSDKDSQVTIVLSGDWLEEAQRIAEAKSEPGLAVTRADVLRIAIRRGLDFLHGQIPAAKGTKTRK